MTVPLYGFLEGDTIGLLLLADPDEPVGRLGERLARAAAVRVAPGGSWRVEHAGKELDQTQSVAAAGLEALDRIDVRRRER